MYIAGANPSTFPLLDPTDPASKASTLIGYDKASLITDGEVDFQGTYTIDDDTKLTLFMGLDMLRDKVNVDLSYIMFDSLAGRFFVGNSKNVSNMMAVTAPDVTTIGLQDTYFTNMIALPYGFAINPATYTIIDNDTAKISYISPQMSGLTIGLSAMPSDSGLTPNNAFYIAKKTKFEYAGNVALLYEKDFGAWNLAIGADYSYAKPTFKGVLWDSTNVIEKAVHQYGGGINVGFGNWTIGGSAHAVNTSDEVGQHMNIGGRNVAKGVSWDAGISYTFGPFATSLNVIQSRANNFFREGKHDIYTLYLMGFNYKIFKGVEWFSEGGYINFNSAMQESYYSNNSPIFATGININF